MTLPSSYSLPVRAFTSLIFALLLSAAAWAAEPTPSPVPAEDAARLAASLDNPETRAQLIAQLKTLALIQPAPVPAEVELLEQLSAKAGDLRIGLSTLAILAVTVLLAWLLHRGVEKVLALGSPKGRANHYLPLLHMVLRTGIGLAGLLALAQLWGFQPLSALNSDLGQRLASSVVHMAVVLVGAIVLWHLLHGAIERYLTATDSDGSLRQRSGRVRTLLPLARNAAFVLLVTMVTLILLSELGVDIAPLLAGAGVLGIAIGFGSQKLVQDIITGIFILFEDTIAVGDSVKLGEHSGTVEAISIRAIRLRDQNGSLHTVPFSAVTTVVNATKGFNYAVFDIGIAYHQDTDRVAALILALGAEMKADPVWGAYMADSLEVQGVERFEPQAVIMRARVKTTPGDRFALGREFNRRIKKCFDAEGIDFSSPQAQVQVAAKALTGA